MKPFVFRLEALRKIRTRREEERQQELAIAAGNYRTAVAALQELQQQLEALLLKCEQEKQLGTTISNLIDYENYLWVLREACERQQEAVNRLNEERQTALKALEAAMKERKAVDKLKAKRLEHYEELRLHEEQKVLDELAGAMSQRYQGSDYE